MTFRRSLDDVLASTRQDVRFAPRAPTSTDVQTLTIDVSDADYSTLGHAAKKRGLTAGGLIQQLLAKAIAAFSTDGAEPPSEAVATEFPPERATEKVGGVAGACSALAAGSDIPERREPDEAPVAKRRRGTAATAKSLELPAAGAGHSERTLTPDEVRLVRSYRAATWHGAEIAAKIGVSVQLVRKVPR